MVQGPSFCPAYMLIMSLTLLLLHVVTQKDVKMCAE